ncbi:MAG: thiamine phosphate synthase [Actinomycetota bacterium]|nr:thiamine phosphate synthase [Actinomycetota bacterium]
MDYSLYVITADVPKLGRTHLDVAREAVKGGATIIQFREKGKSTREVLEMAMALHELLADREIPLIINDRLDIALAVGALGVHIGQDDMSLEMARRILGSERIIGVSARNLEEAVQAARGGADYLGVGPIFATSSKGDAGEPTGLKTLSDIKKTIDIPIVAIGGVSLDNVEAIIEAGADGVAVISAVAFAPEMRRASEDLLGKIIRAKKNKVGEGE